MLVSEISADMAGFWDVKNVSGALRWYTSQRELVDRREEQSEIIYPTLDRMRTKDRDIDRGQYRAAHSVTC
jgi:hypothetical protein